MGRRKSTAPTEAELQILQVAWKLKAVTVRDLHDAVSKERAISSSAVSSTVDRMVEKGLLRVKDARRPQTFEAVQDAESTHRHLLQTLANAVAGGSIRRLLIRSLGRPSGRKVASDAVDRLLDKLKE